MQVEENFIKLDTGSAFQLAYPDSDWLDDNRYKEHVRDKKLIFNGRRLNNGHDSKLLWFHSLECDGDYDNEERLN